MSDLMDKIKADQCVTVYGDFNADNFMKPLYILDPLGYLKIRRNLAWNLYFKISRQYSDPIRSMYFVIYEIASIVREMNFRNINMNFALPSILDKINTSLKLAWKDNTISIKDPINIEIDIDLYKMIKSSIENDFDIEILNQKREVKNQLDLYKLSNVKGLALVSAFSYENGKIKMQLNLNYSPPNKGLNREISADELNRILRITAKEVNEKSIDTHSSLEEFMIDLIESLIEPILSEIKENIANKLGFKEVVYIPSCRPFILNAEESALNSEEIAQLFTDSCQTAINRIRSGKSNFFENYGFEYLKNSNGIVIYEDKPVINATKYIKSISALILELNSIKDQSLVIIENPEEYSTEDKYTLIINILKKLLEKGNKILVITYNRNFLDSLKAIKCHVK
ncbi:hypothetical protein DFR86_07790 [Acidianus sulfidivorans JP7]|uniref:Uncharacterized protein n=1 Tax=Acidianus sulfidivorans JP7 TaxID=619593 RepID=A0A2U9IN49_9CREN|nr:hypothetical protein [Acidianus sulfidivorans]AWR97458.1 hypothetical protein DFR86_07790 [Acidianus sulfidivorans JP7]